MVQAGAGLSYLRLDPVMALFYQKLTLTGLQLVIPSHNKVVEGI